MARRLNEVHIYSGKDKPVPMNSTEGAAQLGEQLRRRVPSGSEMGPTDFGRLEGQMTEELMNRRERIRNRLFALDKKRSNPNEIRSPAHEREIFIRDRIIEIEREGQKLLEELGSLREKEKVMRQGFQDLGEGKPVSQEFRALVLQEEDAAAEAMRQTDAPMPQDRQRLKAMADLLQAIGRKNEE